MTLSAAERAAISRQNGQKSQGPRSAEGKERSRFNALKHGLKAKLPILPGEDPQEYHGRLQAWLADMQPGNDVEQRLVERAVTITWQLDRAERAEAARLTRIIREAPAEAARRQEDEAAALGHRLFFDRRGPLPLYPHDRYYFHERNRISSSGLSDDPDDPPRLLLRLEATSAGCRWLLERWAELGALLDRGLSWQSPDKLKAIRLLGRQPLDAADSDVVATIFQASHVLDPQTHHQAGVAMVPAAARDVAEPEADSQADEGLDLLADGVDEEAAEAAEVRIAWQRCGAAFTELLGELTAEEGDEYRRRLEGRQVDRLRPQDPAAARTTLRALVEKAVIRLQAKLEVHEAHAAQDAAEAGDLLCFDVSPEGEQLRRFQLAGQRALLRTVDSLMKLRRSEPPRSTESEPAESAGTGATVADLTATICCGLDGIHSTRADDLLPTLLDAPAGPPSAPEPVHDVENLPNEPGPAPRARGDGLPPASAAGTDDAGPWRSPSPSPPRGEGARRADEGALRRGEGARRADEGALRRGEGARRADEGAIRQGPQEVPGPTERPLASSGISARCASDGSATGSRPLVLERPHRDPFTPSPQPERAAP